MADIGATTTRCALLDDKGQERRTRDLRERRLHRRRRRAARLSRSPPRQRPADARRAGRRGADHRRRSADDQHRLALLAERAASRSWTSNVCKSSTTSPRSRGRCRCSTPADVVQIGGGESVPRTTLAALGPGSGLGVSALVPAADGWAVMTGEGGHVTMPAATREEQDVIALLARAFRRPLLGGARAVGPGPREPLRRARGARGARSRRP